MNKINFIFIRSHIIAFAASGSATTLMSLAAFARSDVGMSSSSPGSGAYLRMDAGRIGFISRSQEKNVKAHNAAITANAILFIFMVSPQFRITFP